MSDRRADLDFAEKYDLDDLARLRRIHDQLDGEYRLIPEHPLGRRTEGFVPSVCERPAVEGGGSGRT
jgi:hypothetical protein